MTNMERKLEFEKIYKEYCMSELNAMAECFLSEKDKEDNEMLKSFVKFRLSVSGGSESSMGDIGCETVKGFVNEIILYSDLIADSSGCYRGEFAEENLEALEALLEESELEDEVKLKVVELFNEYYGIDEE
jgi:hypothetical protein